MRPLALRLVLCLVYTLPPVDHVLGAKTPPEDDSHDVDADQLLKETADLDKFLRETAPELPAEDVPPSGFSQTTPPPSSRKVSLLPRLRGGGSGFAVFGYLPEYRYPGANLGVQLKHVSHLVFFSLEIDGATGKISSSSLSRSLPKKDFLKEARRQADLQGSRLLVSFGGFGRSGGFREMVADKKKRKRFINDCKNLVQDHDLDGIDLNWEYPGVDMSLPAPQMQLGAEQAKADYDGLFALVKQMRKVFANFETELEKKDSLKIDPLNGQPIAGRSRYLTIALAYYPDRKQEEEVMVNRDFGKYVDWLSAMAYDRAPLDRGHHSSVLFAKETLATAKGIGEKKTRTVVERFPVEKQELGAGLGNAEQGEYTESEEQVGLGAGLGNAEQGEYTESEEQVGLCQLYWSAILEVTLAEVGRGRMVLGDVVGGDDPHNSEPPNANISPVGRLRICRSTNRSRRSVPLPAQRVICRDSPETNPTFASQAAPQHRRVRPSLLIAIAIPDVAAT